MIPDSFKDRTTPRYIDGIFGQWTSQPGAFEHLACKRPHAEAQELIPAEKRVSQAMDALREYTNDAVYFRKADEIAGFVAEPGQCNVAV